MKRHTPEKGRALEEPKKDSFLNSFDYKKIMGFVPGEDDEIKERLDKARAEREARGGRIGWDAKKSAETDGFPDLEK